MLRKRVTVMAVLLGASLAVGPADAVPITFYFGGQIDTIDDAGGVWGGQIHAGSPFSGSYTFDSEAPPHLGDPNTAFYDLTDIIVQVEGETFSTAGSSAYRWIHMINLAADHYAPGANNFQSGRFYITEVSLELSDWTGQAFADASLPRVPPDLGLFHDRGVTLRGWDPQMLHLFDIQGTVTSLTPEPAAWALVLLGALSVLRRR